MDKLQERKDLLVHFLILNELESVFHRAFQSGNNWLIRYTPDGEWHKVPETLIEHIIEQQIAKAADGDPDISSNAADSDPDLPF